MSAELAGVAAQVAALTFVLSAIALALFFGGRGGWWGPVNDVLVAITVLLLVPAIATTMDLAPAEMGWFVILGWLAIAGSVVMAAGQLLLVVGIISLEASFVTGGIGVVPFLAWMAAVGVLAALGSIGLPAIVGWLALATLAVSAALTVAHLALPRPVTWGLVAILTAVAAAWIWSIGQALRTVA